MKDYEEIVRIIKKGRFANDALDKISKLLTEEDTRKDFAKCEPQWENEAGHHNKVSFTDGDLAEFNNLYSILRDEIESLVIALTSSDRVEDGFGRTADHLEVLRFGTVLEKFCHLLLLLSDPFAAGRDKVSEERAKVGYLAFRCGLYYHDLDLHCRRVMKIPDRCDRVRVAKLFEKEMEAIDRIERACASDKALTLFRAEPFVMERREAVERSWFQLVHLNSKFLNIVDEFFSYVKHKRASLYFRGRPGSDAVPSEEETESESSMSSSPEGWSFRNFSQNFSIW